MKERLTERSVLEIKSFVYPEGKLKETSPDKRNYSRQ